MDKSRLFDDQEEKLKLSQLKCRFAEMGRCVREWAGRGQDRQEHLILPQATWIDLGQPLLSFVLLKLVQNSLTSFSSMYTHACVCVLVCTYLYTNTKVQP